VPASTLSLRRGQGEVIFDKYSSILSITKLKYKYNPSVLPLIFSTPSTFAPPQF
jgi:hypothetical protein